MNLYPTLIAAAIAAALGFGAAWEYQAHRIDAINIAQLNATKAAQAAALEKDAKYAQLSSDLAARIEASRQSVVSVTDSVRKSVATNGLHVHASCPRLPDASASASTAADAPALVQLSADDAEKLRSEAERADEAAGYAQAGFEYARLIEQWIKDRQ